MTKNRKRSLFLAATLMVSAVFLASQASAVVLLQDSPVFTTPAPEEQKLGPAPEKAYLKSVVTYQEGMAEQKSIEAIEFEGNRFYRDSVVEDQLEPLQALRGQPVDINLLESKIVQINRNNTFKLKATIEEGGTPDTAKLHLDVHERQPWQIITSTDNQGRPHIGTWRQGTMLTNESLFGFADRLSLQYLRASGSTYAGGAYDFPINRWGGTIGLAGEYSHVDMDGEFFDPLDWGEQYAGTLRYIQPIGEKRYWTGDLGFTMRHINVNATHPDLRFFNAGLRFNRPDSYGATNLYLQSWLGLDFLGSDTRFWRIRGQGNRLFKLPHNQELNFRAAAQYSPDALPPIQMFQMAGAYMVRGYSEGLLYADSAIFGSAEYRWPIPFMDKLCPWLNDRVRGVAFVDATQGWLRKSRTAANYNTSLVSAGLGLRARLSQYLQGFVDFGWGIGKQDNFNAQNLVGPNVSPGLRIHFGIRSHLLPASYL